MPSTVKNSKFYPKSMTTTVVELYRLCLTSGGSGVRIPLRRGSIPHATDSIFPKHKRKAYFNENHQTRKKY